MLLMILTTLWLSPTSSNQRLMSDTILQILLLVPSLIIAIVFHEVAHGLVARALGDPTAQEQHRLSLNPLRHVDPVGTIILPGFMALIGGPIFGWAKPVPVDYARLDHPRRDMILVAAAGPGTNIALGAIGAVLLGLIAGVKPIRGSSPIIGQKHETAHQVRMMTLMANRSL